MRLRAWGPSGLSVPVVGQGTWGMERDDRARAHEAIRSGLDHGMTHVDTAEIYGKGEVERLVGEAIRGRREEVFLVTKIDPERASRSQTARALDESLSRLGTDHVDVYLLHWAPSHPLEECVSAMESARTSGKTLAWGISNFDTHQVEETVRLAGRGRVVCNQVLHHLEERSVEHAVVPTCHESRISVVGYSPFGSGEFPDPDGPAGRALADVARRLSATPRQVALAFLLEHVDFVIPKAGRPEHTIENAGAADLRLDAEGRGRLEEAFPLGPPRPGIPML